MWGHMKERGQVYTSVSRMVRRPLSAMAPSLVLTQKTPTFHAPGAVIVLVSLSQFLHPLHGLSLDLSGFFVIPVRWVADRPFPGVAV